MRKKQSESSIVRQIIEQIAKERLDLETLESRGSDRLDFKEHNVLAIRDALEEAFDAGFQMCRMARG